MVKIGDGLRENQKGNNIPIYRKMFFKEIYKRNIKNVITLNYYHDGGVYVLLGTSRSDE